MPLFAANHGSYPRIGDQPEHQVLRRTIAQRDRGEKGEADVQAAEDRMTELALRDQLEAGVDVVTDGLIRWNDPVSHLAGKLSGVRVNGLLRFFDTNFYFRQPLVYSSISRTQPLIIDEFKFAQTKSSRPVKPVLTGPYTLARHSLIENSATRRLENLLSDYAEALGAEIAALAAEGAALIQVDEPSLLAYPEDLSLVAESVHKLAAQKGAAQLILSVYFGNPTALYERLQTLAVDALALDFTYNPKLIDMLAVGSSKMLFAGLLDGRNTRLEDASTLARTVEKVMKASRNQTAYLTPSCGLEYLPRDRACLKLKLAVTVKKMIEGSGA